MEYCGCKPNYPDNDLGYFNIYKWLEQKYPGQTYIVEHVVIENEGIENNHRDLYYGRVYGQSIDYFYYNSVTVNLELVGANASPAVLLTHFGMNEEQPWCFIGIKITFPNALESFGA